MAKGIGLIGNFRGKVGNMVGYNLKDSNNKQTQGVRVYQPIVKNPKTAAQAEQRAKLLAVNATYRALKMVIDRGNESLPYGNKSRLAWLRGALKAENMPWFEKGSTVNAPVICQITKGSLSNIALDVAGTSLTINCPGVTGQTAVNTIGALSTALLAGFPFLKVNDQITIIQVYGGNNPINANVKSFVIDSTSTETITGWTPDSGQLTVESEDGLLAGSIIVSRQGDNGEHMRSTSMLIISEDYSGAAPYDADSKAAAIASYRASDASSSDWAEESIQ